MGLECKIQICFKLQPVQEAGQSPLSEDAQRVCFCSVELCDAAAPSLLLLLYIAALQSTATLSH